MSVEYLSNESKKLYNLFRETYNKRLLSADDQAKLAREVGAGTHSLVFFRAGPQLYYNSTSATAIDTTSGSWTLNGIIFTVTIGNNVVPSLTSIDLTKYAPLDKPTLPALLHEASSPLEAILYFIASPTRVEETISLVTPQGAVTALAKMHHIQLLVPISYVGNNMCMVLGKQHRLVDTIYALQYLILEKKLSLPTIELTKQLVQPLPYRHRRDYGPKVGNNIGEGTYGKVYKTAANNKQYAIKELRSRGDVDVLESSTIREIAAMVRLHHPNVINIIDVVIEGDIVYMVMPLASGTLKEAIDNNIDPQLRENYAYQLIRGVAYLQSIDIWNRDLKPQNVLVFHDNNGIKCSTPRLVITDFGLARSASCATAVDDRTNVVYTLWYRPPEILLGQRNYNEKAEIWALGCIIVEIYTKAALFPGDSEIDALFRIFRTLGTPTEATWTGVTQLPEYKDTFPKWTSTFKKKFEGKLGKMYSVVESMLSLDPNRRPSIYQLLHSPVLDTVAKEVNGNPCLLAPAILHPTCEEELMAREPPLVVPTYREFTHPMYMLVVGWLTSVVNHFNFVDRVFFLGVALLRLYLSKINVKREDVQAYSIMCVDVAAKMVSINLVNIADYVHISGDAYTAEKLVRVEVDICKTLGFDTGVSSCYDFLRLYNSGNAQYIRSLSYIMLYIQEFVAEIYKYKEHEKALAALWLSVRAYGPTAVVDVPKPLLVGTITIIREYKTHKWATEGDVLKMLQERTTLTIEQVVEMLKDVKI